MKKYKMPTAFTILLGIIVVVAILTWIIPAGEYVDGTYQRIEQIPQGLWQVISAPIAGFYDAIDIALFVLVIGGFLGIVLKTGAIDASIGTIIRKLKGSEFLLIPILMIFFGIGGTTFGMAEETIAFYPILIPVFLAAGYDVITAVAVILVGSGLGVLSSTVNPFATGAASSAAEIGLGTGLGLRAIMLIVMEVIGIWFIMRYAKKVKADPSKSLVYNIKEENEKHFLGDKKETPDFTSRRKAVLFIFVITFIIMILGVIPWAFKFNIMVFENLNNFLAKIPGLGILNTASDLYWGSDVSATALGDWWFGQMTVLFFISAILIGLVYGMKENEIVKEFTNGARDLLGVALIIGVSRGIKVIMTAGGMDATVLYWAERTLKGLGPVLFTILSYIFYIPMSFLIPSTSGLAGATMPIIAPLAGTIFESAAMSSEVGKALVITAYQSASGIVNLITPTSGVVMGALAIARLPYDKWLKFTFKLLVIVFIVTIIMLAIGTILV